jgi:predicted CXXCH cytochrome family protein
VLHKIARTRGLGRLLRVVPTLVVFGLLIALPALAFGYAHSDGRATSGDRDFSCEDCHVTWEGGTFDTGTYPAGEDAGDHAKDGAGPHGYYRSDTNKCRMCHTVHKAPSTSALMLPAATIEATCFSCHDNTGAKGVYSAIKARNGSVVASHSIDSTTNVPGGSFDLAARLSCPSCHSVHRATTVAPFRTDRAVSMLGGAKTSNALLRDDVGGKPRGTYTKYGADWCAGCHDQRHSGGSIVNHPTEASKTLDPAWVGFDYGKVPSVKGVADQSTETTGLGRSNFGYVMPSPRTTAQAGHDPICQQCHEDARDVGVPGAAVAFSPTNPIDYSFPHQGTTVHLVVEEHDDLCMNCHPVAQLP